MGEYVWFFAIVVGPLLFAAAVVYGLTRRRLRAGERGRQHRKVEKLYGERHE